LFLFCLASVLYCHFSVAYLLGKYILIL